MNVATICFVMDGPRILLGMKKERLDGHNFGVGKWNGFGGRVEEGESPQEAARRELQEECGLRGSKEDFEQVGDIQFFEMEKPLFHCIIFILKKWEGTPAESDEMIPQWFEMTEIPYEKMWSSDTAWLPLVLEGKKVQGRYIFLEGMKGMEKFTYEEV